MKPENEQYLKDHVNCIEQIERCDEATEAYKIRYELHRIIQEEFYPGYLFTEACGNCLFDMTRLLYKHFRQYQSEQANKKLSEYGLQQSVKANFPSHKNHHRR